MDAMEVLEACRAAESDLTSLRRRLLRLRQAASGMNGRSDNEGIRSTNEQDRMGAYIVARAGLEQEIEMRKRDKRIEEVASAILIDHALSDQDQVAAVMHAYYVRRESYKEISCTEHLSVSRIRNIRLQGAALLRAVSPSYVAALLPPEYRSHREDEDE